MLRSDEIPSISPVSLEVPDLGLLSGISLNSEVDQYFGIPYGEIPGRFRRSKLVTRWKDGKHDGTKLGPYCPQPPRDFYPVPTPARPWLETPPADEFNCLNLNISVPKLSRDHQNQTLPVMVFFHGGAFTYATAASPIYDGRMLAARSAALGKPTIIVTVNYRLGVYGFLAGHDLQAYNLTHGDEGVGNNGIWDQVLALRWVQRYIGAFGGDSSRVTVFGQSAGAASVHAHLLREEELFSSAILQSGHLWLCGVYSIDEYQVTYERILATLGISLELPPEERLQKLLEVDQARLTAAMEPVFISPIVTTPLCDDGVLIKGPMPLNSEDTKFVVPAWCKRVMIGDARNECIIWNKSWDNLSPTPLVAGQDLARPSADLTLKRMEAYLGAETAGKFAARYGLKATSSPQEVFWALEKMTTHGLYGAPNYFYTLDAVAQDAQTYGYHFDVPSPFENAWGGLAHHSYDNVLIWGVLRHIVPAEQQAVGDEMAEAWISFANGDEPWERSVAGQERWMVFGDSPQASGLRSKEENMSWGYEEWDELRKEGLVGALSNLSMEVCLRKSEALTPFADNHIKSTASGKGGLTGAIFSNTL